MQNEEKIIQNKEKVIKVLEDILYKVSKGYTVTEKKEEITPDGDMVTLTNIKHIKPDVKALIFALTNLDPENWQERKQIQNGMSADNIFIVDDIKEAKARFKNGS